MKRVFQYRSISLWLILGYAMTFLVFNFRAQSNIITESERAALEASAFNYAAAIRIEMTDKNSDVDVEAYIRAFLTELCQGDFVITVEDLYLEFKPGLSYAKSADICISDNMPRYPLYKGAYPTKQQLESGGGYAVVGYSRKSEVYRKNGIEYIDFNNEAFQVTGYLSKDAEWLVESGALLFCGCNSEGAWKYIARYLEDGYLYVRIESDETGNLPDSFEQYNERAMEISNGSFFVKYVQSVGYSIIGEVHKVYSKALTETAKTYALYICVFLFVMLCFMVEFFMKQRRSEFITMRKHGFSVYNIIGRFYKELLLYALFGAVLGAAVNLVLGVIFDGYIAFSWTKAYAYFVIFIVYIVGVTLITSAFSVIRMMRDIGRASLSDLNGGGK